MFLRLPGLPRAVASLPLRALPSVRALLTRVPVSAATRRAYHSQPRLSTSESGDGNVENKEATSAATAAATARAASPSSSASAPNAARSSSSSSSSPSAPLPVTEFDYYADALLPLDAEGYRAAGVLAFRRTPTGRVQFLFGRESNPDAKKFRRLNVLGGKVDPDDRCNSRVTACREFAEECGGLLTSSVDELVARMDAQRHGVLWFRAGKYALYMYEMTRPEDELRIVDTYNAAARLKYPHTQPGQSTAPTPSPAGQGSPSEMLALAWVDRETLAAYLDACAPVGRRPNSINTARVTAEIGERQAHWPMLSFCVSMLNNTSIREKIAQLTRSGKELEAAANFNSKPNN